MPATNPPANPLANPPARPPDEFDPGDVISVGGAPRMALGQLAELAFAHDPPGHPTDLGTLLTTLTAAARSPLGLTPGRCATQECQYPPEYLGTFVNPDNPARNMPDTAYCQRCGYLTYSAGMYTDVHTLYGHPAVPPEPYLGRHDTAIGWTHMPGTRGRTIVSVTGCDPVSPGCDNCYSALASSMPRLTRLEKYAGVAVDGKFTGLVKTHPLILDKALTVQQRCTYFHNSMSDTFHPKVADGHIAYWLSIVAATPRHNWIQPTKRHARMASLLTSTRLLGLVEANWERRFPGEEFPGWPLANLAVGVSVEDQDRADMRMPYAERIVDDVACVVVSAEPLLERTTLRRWLNGPARDKLWVIAGGESGPGHRPVDLDHVRQLRDECGEAGVPFYYKQEGGLKPTSGGRILDGLEHDGWPAMAYRPVPGWRRRKATR